MLSYQYKLKYFKQNFKIQINTTKDITQKLYCNIKNINHILNITGYLKKKKIKKINKLKSSFKFYLIYQYIVSLSFIKNIIFVNLPKKKKKFNLLKSAFIHKKAQQSFLYTIKKKLFRYNINYKKILKLYQIYNIFYKISKIFLTNYKSFSYKIILYLNNFYDINFYFNYYINCLLKEMKILNLHQTFYKIIINYQ
jgi:hypothetical protein